MICIAGKNDIATNVLTFVTELYGPTNVVAVANRDDTGRITWQHSLIATATRLGVRLITLDEAYELPNLHFFSVEFDRIVIPERFRQAELYNIHFSLLPRYKGVYTAIWPILNGETATGVTLHRIEAGIDTGPIIYQVERPIAVADTARDIYCACLAMGYEVLREFIPRLVEQPMPGTPQPLVGSTYYGPKSIDFATYTINLRQTAYQIHNTVRAFTFQEYQLPTVLGRRVGGSRLSSTSSTARPGTLLAENEQEFWISTIDFDLCLIKDYSLELLAAIQENNVDRVQQVVHLVSNLEVSTRQGWTPLMVAAYANNLPMVKQLIQAGAHVNAVNKKGTSVLMYAKSVAAQTGDLQLVQYLLEQGADATATDITGKSVVDYARLENNPAVVQCLEQWIANQQQSGTATGPQ